MGYAAKLASSKNLDLSKVVFDNVVVFKKGLSSSTSGSVTITTTINDAIVDDYYIIFGAGGNSASSWTSTSSFTEGTILISGSKPTDASPGNMIGLWRCTATTMIAKTGVTSSQSKTFGSGCAHIASYS